MKTERHSGLTPAQPGIVSIRRFSVAIVTVVLIGFFGVPDRSLAQTIGGQQPPWLSYSMFGSTGPEPFLFSDYNSSIIVDPTMRPDHLNPAPLSFTDTRDPSRGYVITASASYGSLAASVSLNGAVAPMGYAASSVWWADAISVISPTVTGPGRLQASIRLTGSAFAVGSGTGTMTVSNFVRAIRSDNINVPYLVEHADQWEGSRTVPMDGSVDTIIDFFMNFDFNTSQPIGVNLGVYAAGIGSGSIDFSHTLTWLGISEVRDAQGNLVSDYTVSSLSGTDWTQPVPEPASGALLILGGGLGALVARSKRLIVSRRR